MPRKSAYRLTPEIREMWEKGVPTTVVAAHLGTTPRYALVLAKRWGLANRPAHRPKSRRTAVKPEPEPIKVDMLPDGLPGDLLRTQGRYSKLAEIADREGWSLARTQQEFHRARSEYGAA